MTMVTTPLRGVEAQLSGVVHLYPSPEGDVVALRGVDLDIPAGEAVALLGPSGAGKSTVLSLLAGEFSASAGLVRVAGHNLAKMSDEALAALRAREISLVVQGAAANLLPYATADENVWFAQRGARRRGKQIEYSASDLLELFGLSRIANVPVEHCSTGDRQRLALVTGVAVAPRLLLVDEPTSQLSVSDRDLVIEMLFRIHDELAMTIVVVTHDAAVAQHFARTVTILDGRVGAEGRKGTEYSVIGQDGSVRIPNEMLESMPPGSFVRFARTDTGLEMHLAAHDEESA
ncbi:MAG: ATP-binding cassette domain-containing protein [Acidimicrobiales bacterium]